MRPYTPIECRGEEFDCIIKIYANGAMTQVLDKLEKGAEMKVRGTFSDVLYRPDKNVLSVPGFAETIKVKNLGMIAGGTGIAPCY